MRSASLLMAARRDPCEHLRGVERVSARASGCEECLAMGAQWNELRVCLSCGHVGCCEDSEHAHALQHFKASGHPLIASLERGETWGWCYLDNRYFDLPLALRPAKRSLLARLLGRRER
jgi:uncharacterized UBP type Zn finger protein